MTSESGVSGHGPFDIDLASDFQLACITRNGSNQHAKRFNFNGSRRDIPRLVRFSVSGANPTLKVSSSNSVTVRQAPFTQIESPIWQSSRIDAASLKVNVKPSKDSAGVMLEMVTTCSTWICSGNT